MHCFSIWPPVAVSIQYFLSYAIDGLGGGYRRNTPNKRVRTPRGNVNHKTDLSIEVNRRITNAWCSFRKNTHELYDRASALLELKTRMLRAEVLKTMLSGCVTWSPRACHYDTRSRVHHSFLTRCIGWRKNDGADHLISYLDTLIKTRSESIEATLCSRRILFAGCVVRMEYTRLPKCVMFGELVGGAGCVRGAGKRVTGVFPGRPQSLRHQRRPVDDYSPGRGGMAQDGGTRSGTFHGEIDRCREGQGWTTACSSMPERDGKDQGEDSPNQAGSCWFARVD